MAFNAFSLKRQAVEKSLQDYFPNNTSYSGILYEAMKYSLFAGGKRFRPVLALMVYEAIKDDFEKALPAACALEYVHTYSLIHDDLPSIDNDDVRRGKPTCHKKYGEAIALLAGDALFAEAFRLIGEKQKAAPEILVEVIKELAAASGAGGMVGGQVLDVMLSGRKEVSEDEIFFVHSNKTGKLIVAAAKIGAKLAQATNEQLKAVEEYSHNLGMAFQIYDDILDEIGDSEVMGKTAGSDREQEKVTYPYVYGLQKAKEIAFQSSQQAIASLKPLKSENLVRLADYVVGRDK